MHGLVADFRFGLRMLLRRPGVAFVAILTLALGIGAGTAMFSVVDAVLLRPLPYPDADRLVFVWSTFSSSGGLEGGSALPDYRIYRDENETLTGLGGFFTGDVNLSSPAGSPEIRQAARVTETLLPVLGIAPIYGRLFNADDMRWEQHRVTILSHRLWQERYGGDPDIIGRDVLIAGRPYKVVGILPRGMPFLDDVPKVDLYTPLVYEPGDGMDSRNNHFVTLVGRLRSGVDVDKAQADLTSLALRIAREDPKNAGIGAKVRSVHEQLTRDSRPALVILLGAVALLLLVACVNVANLLLARAVDRQREMAVRASLGATPGRLFRQVLVEAFIIAAVAGGLGLLLAWWGLEVIVSLLPDSIPRQNVIGIDGRVLAFGAVTSMLTVLLFGTLPALQVARAGLQDRLKEVGAQVTDAPRRRRLRAALVAGEMALALVLLVGAALLGRSFMKLQSADPGFAAEGMVALRVPLTGPRYGDDKAGVAFFSELSDRLRAIPGVTAVGMGTRLPLRFGAGWGKYFWVDDWPAPPSVRDVPGASFALVGEDYFRALGMPIRTGRPFARGDDMQAPQVAIVNETVAKKFFHGDDPVGRYIYMCAPKSVEKDSDCPRRQIVGLVADTSTEALGRAADAYVYVPYRQFEHEGWVGELTVILRGGGTPAAVVAAAREQLRGLDRNVPIGEIVTGADLRARSVALNRFSLILLGLFAGLAATLAGVGIYSVVSYLAARRTHEMGIRLALGARPRDVQLLVLAQGLRMLGAGVVVGLAGALALTRLLQSQLYGVTSTDVLAYVAVTGALAAVAILACWLPARRAARVDPMTSLRSSIT